MLMQFTQMKLVITKIIVLIQAFCFIARWRDCVGLDKLRSCQVEGRKGRSDSIISVVGDGSIVGGEGVGRGGGDMRKETGDSQVLCVLQRSLMNSPKTMMHVTRSSQVTSDFTCCCIGRSAERGAQREGARAGPGVRNEPIKNLNTLGYIEQYS